LCMHTARRGLSSTSAKRTACHSSAVSKTKNIDCF
jgi:hypothetical protein